MLRVCEAAFLAILSSAILASGCISGCEKESDVTSLVQIKRTVVFGSDRPDVPFSTDRKGPEQPKPCSAGQQAGAQAIQQGQPPVLDAQPPAPQAKHSFAAGQQIVLQAAPQGPPQVQQLTVLPVQPAQPVQQAQQVQQLTIQPQVQQQTSNPQMQQPMVLMPPVAQAQPTNAATLSTKAQEEAAYLQWKSIKDAENAALFGNSATSSTSALSELNELNVTALASKKAYETAAVQQWQRQKDEQDKLLFKVLQAKKMAEDKVAMKLWQAQKAEEASQLAALVPDGSSGVAPPDNSAPMPQPPQMPVAPPPDDPSLASMAMAGQPQPDGSILVPLGPGGQPQGQSTDGSLAAVVPGSSEMLGPTVANLTPIMAETTAPVIPPALAQGQPYGNFAAQPDGGSFASAPPGDLQVQPAISEQDRQAALLMGVMPGTPAGAMMTGAPVGALIGESQGQPAGAVMPAAPLAQPAAVGAAGLQGPGGLQAQPGPQGQPNADNDKANPPWTPKL